MQTDLSNVKALVFDVFGTVVDWRTSIIADLTAFGRKKGISADWAEFTDEWRGAYRPTLNRVIKGELPFARLDDLHRGTLDGLLERFGVKGLSEADKDYVKINVGDFLNDLPQFRSTFSLQNSTRFIGTAAPSRLHRTSPLPSPRRASRSARWKAGISPACAFSAVAPSRSMVRRCARSWTSSRARA